MEIRNFMDDVNIDKTNINNTSGLKFNWSYHINDPNGLIYKDVEKLKSVYNI
jgi:hypothetical protein